MGHVVFAVPSIERFGLHERIARCLQRRGHRITVLTSDPVTSRCYGLHGLPAVVIAEGRRPTATPVELNELAARDLRLRGMRRPGLGALRAHRGRLERFLGPVGRWFETDLPDLVWIHEVRNGAARAVHAVARHFGVPTVHTGPGGLPGTIQRDAEGIDGDAESANRLAIDYRDVPVNRGLIEAALATALGGPALDPPRRMLLTPDAIDVLAAWLAGLRHRALRGVRDRLEAWRRAALSGRLRDVRPFPFPPKAPFVTVLIQTPDDPRVCLDVDPNADLPRADELVRLVTEAARMHDPELGVHVVPPHAGAAGRAAAAATAAAIVTINDPLALVGILAGTPVVHLGRACYGIPGVARRADRATLGDELALALGAEQPTLRLRFATRILHEDLIWCDPDTPDENGLAGLVRDFEDRLERAVVPPPPLVYRPEPPLA